MAVTGVVALVASVGLAGTTSAAPGGGGGGGGGGGSKFRAFTGSCGKAVLDPKAEHPTFVLQNDVGPCSSDGLIFKASHVTLDLNGHTIKGTPLTGPATNPTGGFGEGVGIRIVGNSGVTITNSKASGGIKDFDSGILIQRGEQNPARGNVVKNVRVYSNTGRQQQDGGSVGCGPSQPELPCEVSDFNDGISLVGAENSTIGPNNLVELNGSGGIRLDDGAVNNTIIGNTVQDNVGNGVRFMTFATNNVVTGNTLRRNASGVNFSFRNPDNLVENNTITANRGFGVATSWESQRTTIRNNVVTNNLGGGINLGSGENTVTGNQVLDNGKAANGLGKGNGISLGSGTDNFPRVGTVVSGNTVTGSGGNGIRINCISDQDPVNYAIYGCVPWDIHNQILNNVVTGNAVNGPAGTKVKTGVQVVGYYDLLDSTNTDATLTPYDPASAPSVDNPDVPYSGGPITNCDTNVWSGNTFTTAYPLCTTGP